MHSVCIAPYNANDFNVYTHATQEPYDLYIYTPLPTRYIGEIHFLHPSAFFCQSQISLTITA